MESESVKPVYGEVHKCTIELPGWIDGKSRYRAIVEAMKKNGNWPCQGTRTYLPDGKRGEYVWEDGNTVLSKINKLALGLKELGLKKGDKVGIMSKNRPEWTIADIACTSQGCVVVPIYDSYGPDNCKFIISSTEQVCVFVGHDNVNFMREACSHCPTVKNIILFDGTPPDEEYIRSVNASDKETRKGIEEIGFSHLYSEIMEMGGKQLNANPFVQIENPEMAFDDLATIVFTSGTSGVPKGAMLSDHSLLKGGWTLSGRATNVPYQDIIVSYLPLAHIFQRSIEIVALTLGIGIGYFSGSIPQLTDDLFHLKPTLFPVVPRVLSKICMAIKDKISKSGAVTRSLFKAAYFLRQKAMIDEWPTMAISNPIMKKVSSMFGGRLRVVFCGSAPLSPDIGRFLNVVMGGRVLEGYGQTEACGASFAMIEVDHNYGSVGHILPGVEACLMSVPEMGYLATANPPQGEVCLRGWPVFMGYYNDPEATKRTLADGWLHTGDVGQWLPGGQLKIIDRLKNVFKLQQGEFVYVEDIEGCLATSDVIDQIMIYGEPLMSGLVAIVVPNKKALLAWGKETGSTLDGYEEAKKSFMTSRPSPSSSSSLVSSQSDSSFSTKAGWSDDNEYEFLCTFQPAIAFVAEHIHKRLVEAKRKGFEIPRSIFMTPVEFSIENGQLTPTHKARREVIKAVYRKQLDEMSRSLQ
ncbi:long-chain-fatty-acid--CoA ligase [Monocercomonoides exilis]|uniref:long-chain-fatty-acid--CoA ligase n=1 Tax=Monocercomonoides exilis TaxID=2049356 RepID=UPI003559A384|nr:long-chain-fatty-acid--CoA ligase [Monocercomonoides exilis]|eukprot:MONOS_4280.1-p1 / transcript=MONOS_4280.1 / gene=MONOS_4280 / organism=Monocercomonoides_exilis_PA203 / gene_product=long-chain-fatty-acid--CoA ligase [EC:6.2.1.3] / transcript_product=long-chain-fatty-acid--CoA ligase [EC:6.2.1.3] / location=Mono_scaffold00112:3605-5686(-) / protein_length=694 / sequence_SO=supercontig / SO=protein_coding / is_pseudo=false